METSSDVRLGPAGRGGPVILGRMSQLGQELPRELTRGAAAATRDRHVRFGPQADIRTVSLRAAKCVTDPAIAAG
jgi:hypothetical protein